MYKVVVEDMNLEQIMNSGQTFRMESLGGDTYSVKASERYVEITANNNEFVFSCSETEFYEFWHDYFDLDTDYGVIKKKIDPGSSFLRAAVDYGGGIRILKQDVWEMLITFIISQQKQINNIKKCVERLCEKYGEHKITERHEWYGFPTPERIAAGGLTGLSDIGLGYRDRYIYETACAVRDDKLICERLKGCSYTEAMKLLKGFRGVGEKVANCICLFSLALKDSFPVDVHIQDILYREYYKGSKTKKKMLLSDYQEIVDETFSRYSGYRGIIQQWIFAYELTQRRKDKGDVKYKQKKTDSV